MLEERNLTEIYPRHAFRWLILQYNMGFCQFYVGLAHGLTRLWKFSAVVPYFFNTHIHQLLEAIACMYIITCLKGRKLWVHLYFIPWSNVLTYSSLSCNAPGCNLTVCKCTHIFPLTKLIILYFQYHMTCRGKLSKPQGVWFCHLSWRVQKECWLSCWKGSKAQTQGVELVYVHK